MYSLFFAIRRGTTVYFADNNICTSAAAVQIYLRLYVYIFFFQEGWTTELLSQRWLSLAYTNINSGEASFYLIHPKKKVCACARVHVWTCVRLIILILVCGIMYHIRAYLVSARYQPATKIRICRYVCARVGYVLCATYVRKRSKAHSNEYENNIHKA